jgi:methyl-accepting chemotaxis protein
MNFADMKISAKLALAFGAMLTLTVVLGVFALYQISQLTRNTEDIAGNWLPSVQAAGELNAQLALIRRQELQHVMAVDPAELDDFEKRMDKTLTQSRATIERYEKHISSPEERKLYDQFSEQWRVYLAEHDKLIPLSRSGVEHKEAARALMNATSRKALRAAEAKLQDLVALNAKGADVATVDARAGAEAARLWVVGLLIGIVAVGVTFALFIARAIARPLQAATEAAGHIAEGDLTATIPPGGRDETGQLLAALTRMQRQLRDMVTGMQASADELSSASSQLTASSSQVAHGSQAQSGAASSMAAAVEEMTVSIGQVAEHARDAHGQSVHSADESRQGAEVISATVAEITRIAQSVQESAKLIQGLGQQSSQISAIVDAIKGIAEQTNLLALNAAIEAARAGEQGRGFAVVADEVRQLAERTTKATQEIGGLISRILADTQTAVGSMEAGVERVSSGVAEANRASEAIGRIQGSSQTVVKVMDEIAVALKEQTTASTDIARNIERIAQMSEQNSAAVDETARAAEHLEALAVKLHGTVARFRV